MSMKKPIVSKKGENQGLLGNSNRLLAQLGMPSTAPQFKELVQDQDEELTDLKVEQSTQTSTPFNTTQQQVQRTQTAKNARVLTQELENLKEELAVKE